MCLVRLWVGRTLVCTTPSFSFLSPVSLWGMTKGSPGSLTKGNTSLSVRVYKFITYTCILTETKSNFVFQYLIKVWGEERGAYVDAVMANVGVTVIKSYPSQQNRHCLLVGPGHVTIDMAGKIGRMVGLNGKHSYKNLILCTSSHEQFVCSSTVSFVVHPWYEAYCFRKLSIMFDLISRQCF